MPIPFIAHLINLSPVFYEKYVFTNIQKYILLIILFYLLKKCFSGTNNKADRRFNGSVFLITGGTSGIVRSCSDSWTIDYINDLRARTNNHMIFAETCNLSSLYSIRQFATKWIDNIPPRRLDMLLKMVLNYIGEEMLGSYGFGIPSKRISFITSLEIRISNYKRPDEFPNNVRCYVVDPGFVRSHMTLRFLSFGSLWGLLLYIIMWPLWYIVLKSCKQGAQSLLYCIMSSECGTGQGGKLIVKCSMRDISTKKYINSDISSNLWKITETYIMDVEKKEAIKRNILKKKHKLPESFIFPIESTSSQSVKAIHDTFRFGLKSSELNINSHHDLEIFLRRWKHEEHESKMELLNRIFGISELVRRKMELKIIDSEFRPIIFGNSSNIHHDILTGNDSSIDIDEIFLGDEDCFVDFHILNDSFYSIIIQA
ncbi:hypothetical protein MERGE_002963 [Pneumocystis wakefieldiae]|uniref:Uncharacterized protein n=1 Tax=Pneumocystis wakefieldiae TaxID=38082 RepID=A0A899FNV1_9ASCO|nr:hypothetical protein MERGE_002963 [Pneumocystis wakefieldiae]